MQEFTPANPLLFTACSSDKNSGSKSAPVRPCSVSISLSLSQGFCSDTTPFSFMVAHLELTRWPLKDSAAQPASSKVAVQCPCWSKITYAVNFLPHQNERRCMKQFWNDDWVGIFSWVGGLRRHKKGVFPWTCQKCAKLPCGIMTESVDSVRFHTSSLLLFLSASTAPLFASVLFFLLHFLSPKAFFVSGLPVPPSASLSLTDQVLAAWPDGSSYRRSE